MKSDFYVYCFFRPDTGEPCYIGKGRGDRWKEHFTKKKTNTHLRRIIAKSFGEIPHVKLCVGLTEQQAHDYEISWIKALGREPIGPLVNLTDGGEGLSGHNFSDEHRKKLSASIRGRKISDEQKRKQSAAMKGRTRDPAITEKIVSKLRGKRQSPEAIEARRASLVGHVITDQTKAKIAAKAIGRKASDETRANMSRSRLGNTNCVGYKATDNTKAKMRAAKKGKPWSAARRAAHPTTYRHNLATHLMCNVPLAEQRNSK